VVNETYLNRAIQYWKDVDITTRTMFRTSGGDDDGGKHTSSFGVLLSAGLMIWQHRLLHPDDLSRIQAAFFTANGAIAIVLLAAGCIDIYLLLPSR